MLFLSFSVDDTWVKIKDSINACAEEKIQILEKNISKPLFDQECSELANKRNQENLLWLLYPNDETSEDITNNRWHT